MSVLGPLIFETPASRLRTLVPKAMPGMRFGTREFGTPGSFVTMDLLDEAGNPP